MLEVTLTGDTAVGRRLVPSARSERRWWKVERGVSDPGAGLRLSPRSGSGVAHAPHVVGQEGALVVLDLSGEFAGQSCVISAVISA